MISIFQHCFVPVVKAEEIF